MAGVPDGLDGRKNRVVRFFLVVFATYVFFPCVFVPFVEEIADEGASAATGSLVEFGYRGDFAMVRVVKDFVHGFFVAGLQVGLREVEAGDLEAIEKEAGASGVDAVVGDAKENLADGVLDGRAVFRAGEGELGAAALASVDFGGWDWLPAGVVVVAK